MLSARRVRVRRPRRAAVGANSPARYHTQLPTAASSLRWSVVVIDVLPGRNASSRRRNGLLAVLVA
eukprot:scaffold706_cov418-Prasinococcus_capsulatus_cf.AAC.13